MLSINNLSFFIGNRILYDEVSLHIKPKDKIGLIGANGTGKSTLLKLITGDYTADDGDISKSNDCTIGFLNQDLLSYLSEESILTVAMQAFEEQNKIQKEMDSVLHAMETDYNEKLVDKLTRLQDRFQALDGYSIQSKAEEILEGLGFLTKDLHKPLKNFSGGWRMRVMLAKLLLTRPSLLMLDEPTNHLDLPSIQWIEKYLENYEGAVIVVSHDREFLDNTVKTIVEVSQSKLNIYAGNYSFYLEEKALRAEIQKNAFENQQSKIRQTERFIDRFKAKATKARQVQSRVKSLERMEIIEDVVDETAKINFKFNFSRQPGKIILTLKDISKSYGDLRILAHSHGLINRGDKIALIGANGKGKSTLLRIISGGEQIGGERLEGHNVIPSFYAQHQLESLNVENSLLDELKEAGSKKTETELRGILGCFLFSDDDVFKKIKVLSGGEKSRVALAKVLISEANFLLLDEPTNHLDIQSVNILIQALQQYEGTFVTVSHDRHFINNTANKIWYIEDQQLKEYPGSYAEYVIWSEQQKSQKTKPPASGPIVATNKQVQKETKPVSTAQKNEVKKLYNKISEIEEQIRQLEVQISSAEAEMEKPEVYGNIELLAEKTSLYEKIKIKLNEQQEKWDSLVEEVEKAEKS